MISQHCSICHALAHCRTQIVYPTKNIGHTQKLLFIGEAPGEAEDKMGTGFVGSSGKTLTQLLQQKGLQRNNYSLANIVRCRPPNNRKPTPLEVQNCLPLLAQFIIELQPNTVVLVGLTATIVFLGKQSLWQHILDSRSITINNFNNAHTILRQKLINQKARIIPMPHTSGLTWNRLAPNGERWSKIGEQQVDIALLGNKSEGAYRA